jgi:hypothetical protein
MDIKDVGRVIKFPGAVNLHAPGDVFVYDNDFTQYAAGDWTITTVEAGAGSATEAITADGSDGHWGVLLLTNAAGEDDQDNIQGPEIVKLDKPTYFEARVKVDDSGVAEWFVGLSITDTTIIATGDMSASDSIGFVGGATDAAADAMVFRATKNSTESETSQITIADDTFYKLQFFADGNGNAYAWVDGVFKGKLTTNVPNDEFLAVSFVINNSSAVVRKMGLDRIYVAQQRA